MYFFDTDSFISIKLRLYSSMYNKFDLLRIDIYDLYHKTIQTRIKEHTQPPFPKLDLLLNAIILKSNISKEFVYSYIFTRWFREFKQFWGEVLEGRPIDIIDFHYLRLVARTRFQSVEHTDETNPDEYFSAWNNDSTIYLLYNAIWRYAKSAYMDFIPFYRYLPAKGRILEYGCGVAPFTTGMLRYFPSKKLNYDLTDILQINFLYAIHRLGELPNVECTIMYSNDNTVKEIGYQAIICQAVLEHLPNPVEVVKSFYEALDDNGILVFDYIKGDGTGLDSQQSQAERPETLDFIKTHFTILKGSIDPQNSVGLCVARKHQSARTDN